MTLESVRSICRALPAVTEDVKWGSDLCFCVAGKMFVVVNLEPPHQIAFKCTPETFGELVERPGLIPAPYMARNMWVQEQQLGDALERGELESLVKTSYDLVVAKLPKSKRPGNAGTRKAGTRRTTARKTRKAKSRVARRMIKRASVRKR
ncbi:MAG TPA: MmcQ/YjbR family DNA-binding protein [Vicinamibacterales bacterium]|jgi:predicted DNA-binding protein (MmcQ/YjbR family)|nr:MmcQ/YjbR family DNA-binding protein [Vicinamibacterales bacterium]